MKRIETRHELKIALGSLLIGALAAPIFHVASSIIAPQGFAAIRGDRVWVAPLVFLITWLWSALHTLIFGGMVWPLLHWKRADGFVTYIATALVVAFGLSFVLTGGLPSWELPVMAVLSALAIRLAELRLRTAWPAAA